MALQLCSLVTPYMPHIRAYRACLTYLPTVLVCMLVCMLARRPQPPTLIARCLCVADRLVDCMPQKLMARTALFAVTAIISLWWYFKYFTLQKRDYNKVRRIQKIPSGSQSQ